MRWSSPRRGGRFLAPGPWGEGEGSVDDGAGGENMGWEVFTGVVHGEGECPRTGGGFVEQCFLREGSVRGARFYGLSA